MKDYLKKFIERKKAELKALEARNKSATTVDEVRSIGENLIAIRDEISAAEKQLAELDKPAEAPAEENAERSLNPLASYGQTQKPETTRSENPYGTMEYRKAFKDYIQRGVQIPAELRAGGDAGTTISTDVSAIVPETILNEFVKNVSKVYGQVYSKVRKLNIKGGVKIPISQLSANFHWITESTVSAKQKAGDINSYVEFSYNIGEIRVAQTLLSQIVSLDVFESEIVRIMVEAYVKAMDNGILAGTGSGQLLGITADPRVTNVVSLTDVEFGSWDEWRKQLFGVVPLSKRGQGEFLFTSATVEKYLLTMKDNNDRPIFKEATDITMDNLAGSFYGRPVTLVEPDVIEDFDTASNGDVVGIYWVPTDYAINSNQEWQMKRYFDETTNEWINKGLVVVDGKIVDPSGCYIIKKEV